MVGALLYCSTSTRPDIAFATGLLCRAMSHPSPRLYDAALRVIHYLYSHREVGLCFTHDKAPMSGMSDSDWGVRYSTSGSVFHYCHAAISFSSRKQSCVALSSCEAEIMAASEAAKEAVYLDTFLHELGFGSDRPVSLAVDNTGARDLAYNPEHHQRTKHILRRHFFIRDMVEAQRIVVPFVRSADNLADFFTKPLDKSTFFRLRNLIMGLS